GRRIPARLDGIPALPGEVVERDALGDGEHPCFEGGFAAILRRAGGFEELYVHVLRHVLGILAHEGPEEPDETRVVNARPHGRVLARSAACAGTRRPRPPRCAPRDATSGDP